MKPPVICALVAVSSAATAQSLPLDFTYQWAGGKEPYAIASTVVQKDYNSWGVDAVALFGYQGDGALPVYGGGLEYSTSWRVINNLDFVLKVTAGFVWEQGVSLDRGRPYLGIGAGFRLVQF